jgi:hypothetical protein
VERINPSEVEEEGVMKKVTLTSANLCSIRVRTCAGFSLTIGKYDTDALSPSHLHTAFRTPEEVEEIE